jgi:hypothetical protein
VNDFLNKDVVTVQSQSEHGGVLPMISICALSPVQCTCEAFYDPEIIGNKDHFDKVLPFLCRDVLVYKDTSPDKLDGKGKIQEYSTMEDIMNFVDKDKTIAKISKGGLQKLNCDGEVGSQREGITKDWMKTKIISGQFNKADLFEYAGHSRRTQLVKDCTIVDNTGGPASGKKIPCNGDEFWGEQFMDENRGVCNVFNPCFVRKPASPPPRSMLAYTSNPCLRVHHGQPAYPANLVLIAALY